MGMVGGGGAVAGSGVRGGASGGSTESQLKSAAYPLPPPASNPASNLAAGPTSGPAPYGAIPQNPQLPPLAAGYSSAPLPQTPPLPTASPAPLVPVATYAAPPVAGGAASGGRAPSLLGGGPSASSPSGPAGSPVPPSAPLAGPPPLGAGAYSAPPIMGSAAPPVAPHAVPPIAPPMASGVGPSSVASPAAGMTPTAGVTPLAASRGVPPTSASAGSAGTAKFVGGAATTSGSGGSAAHPAAPAVATGGGSANPVRAARSAKFISADSQATRFDLTADGKLPELILSDAEKTAATEPQAPRGQPWFLIILMTFSILSSVLMLLVDTSSTAGSKSDQAAAREAIRSYYTGQPPNLEPYHRQLRLALQAGQRGDRAEERRLYQEVLTLLRSEGTSKFRGLTGMATSGVDPPSGPPNDRHLERLISILLSDE